MKILNGFTRAANACNAHQFMIHGLAKPFDDYYNYLKCASIQIGRYTMESDGEAVRNKYRPDSLDTVGAFERCAHTETGNEE